MLTKIISGAQTGVDRAALDIAIELDIPYSGWCPKGRLDELGTIPDKYTLLKEVEGDFRRETDNYARRTILNLTEADGTLIILFSLAVTKSINDGTTLTLSELKKIKKPYFLVSLQEDMSENRKLFKKWVENNQISVLNIAGPRESTSPGIQLASMNFLREFLPIALDETACDLTREFSRCGSS